MARIKHLIPYPKYTTGGGYISFDTDRKMIHLYGTSVGMGPADHRLTAEILKKAYPEHTVTIANADEFWAQDPRDGKYAPLYYPWELDKDGNFKRRYGDED